MWLSAKAPLMANWSGGKRKVREKGERKLVWEKEERYRTRERAKEELRRGMTYRSGGKWVVCPRERATNEVRWGIAAISWLTKC